jgi:hypothetical protein
MLNDVMSKPRLQNLIFIHFPYLLYENPSFIIVSAETEYFSTRSWYRNINFLKCDHPTIRYHPRFNLTFFPQNFPCIILLWLSCIWRIRIWIWIHWLCWFRNGVFFKRLMTLTEKSILYNFFLFKSRFCSWLREKQEKSELSCVVQSLTSISNNLPSLRWHWPLTLKINKVPDSLKD